MTPRSFGARASVVVVAYATDSDTRGCSACACTAPTCGGTVGFHNGAKCTAGYNAVALPSAVCTNLTRQYAFEFGAFHSPSAATCSPNVASPTGALTPTQPITLCCTP